MNFSIESLLKYTAALKARYTGVHIQPISNELFIKLEWFQNSRSALLAPAGVKNGSYKGDPSGPHYTPPFTKSNTLHVALR